MVIYYFTKDNFRITSGGDFVVMDYTVPSNVPIAPVARAKNRKPYGRSDLFKPRTKYSDAILSRELFATKERYVLGSKRYPLLEPVISLPDKLSTLRTDFTPVNADEMYKIFHERNMRGPRPLNFPDNISIQ